MPAHTNTHTETKRFAAIILVSLFRLIYMKSKELNFVDDFEREQDILFDQFYYYKKSIPVWILKYFLSYHLTFT